MKFVRRAVEGRQFSDLKVPLHVVSTDVFANKEIVYTEGDVASAVRASISIPGIFKPEPRNGTFMIDGGVLDPVPTRVLRSAGMRRVIAVNVVSSHEAPPDPGRKLRTPGIFDVIMRAIHFMEYEIAEKSCAEADVDIQPDLGDFRWMEFFRFAELVEVGERAAEAALPRIQELLKS